MYNLYHILYYNTFKMFNLIWDSLLEIVGNIAGWDKDLNLLPITVAKDQKKCHDYDMDTVIFIPIKQEKIVYAQIHPSVKHFNPEAYEQI